MHYIDGAQSFESAVLTSVQRLSHARVHVDRATCTDSSYAASTLGAYATSRLGLDGTCHKESSGSDDCARMGARHSASRLLPQIFCERDLGTLVFARLPAYSHE